MNIYSLYHYQGGLNFSSLNIYNLYYILPWYATKFDLIKFLANLIVRFLNMLALQAYIQYIPRNMHTVFALLCFVVVIHWLIFPYPSGLLHWHCGNLTIAPVPAKQPWWIWIDTSCEFIMNDCITTTKQSTTKPCAYFLGYTVVCQPTMVNYAWFLWNAAVVKFIKHCSADMSLSCKDIHLWKISLAAGTVNVWVALNKLKSCHWNPVNFSGFQNVNSSIVMSLMWDI